MESPSGPLLISRGMGPSRDPEVGDRVDAVEISEQGGNDAEDDVAVAVHVDTKGGDEGDVVRWVERVGGLKNELTTAALEPLVTKVADAVFPTGGAWAT